MTRTPLFQVFQTTLHHQIQQLLHQQKHVQSQVLYIPKVSDSVLRLNILYHQFFNLLTPSPTTFNPSTSNPESVSSKTASLGFNTAS